MSAELGAFALVLALLVSVVLATLPLAGAHWKITPWVNLARPAATLLCALCAAAAGLLAFSFWRDDFSVLYVAANSHRELPAIYKLTAVWGSHEGSMLLWQLMLSGWTLAVAWRSRALTPEYRARVLAVLGWISVGLLLFLLFLSNPFLRLVPAAAEGKDLNPLLQDPGMVLHPPLLYMGYVGFSVPFAFAMAALLSGEMGAAWARWSRSWTLAAWGFLTLGILLGSAWAYYVLGWGGWWFWDPVENASFMPWLLGTALLHSLIVTDHRGAFRSWSALLAIGAFSLSLMGTFLVRSGVLTSVHAFAVDPGRGLYILCFIIAVVGSSLWLFAWRAPQLGQGSGSFSLLSREAFLLLNNVMFSAAAMAVLIGTLYPLALDVLRSEKISVGPPYFQAVFLPLMVPTLAFMGVGAVARWKKSAAGDLWRQLRMAALWTGVVSTLLVLASGRIGPRISPATWLGLTLGLWCLLSTLGHLAGRLAPAFRQGLGWQRALRQPMGWWGMLAAHAGIGIFILAVCLADGLERKSETSIAQGETASLGGYEFRFDGLASVSGPNYDAQRAQFTVRHGDRDEWKMFPEKRLFRAQQMPLSQAAIDSRLSRDVFIALGEALDEQGLRWTIRLQVKPFMDWIWVGALMMALGALLSLFDRRFRLHAGRSAASASDSVLAPSSVSPAPERMA
ncbi:heme lyase CcmF/NrfE family subunit [Diaphorobacter ruginosibacter]|uniref:Heme lyase CcmF/NrfE family subunit n=1 Tax=Diaphorobacter ruginosibacter TaxID=1715720 RepID=A0A7G9RJ84_9BURK|nr:heme lyase CcmF/NrfE family subunit [Diaphorobacter ruginosibacter]QNN55659.1 heme lyase CcmF/NrfE family subunit [Diaphorobacter ruginosibacter]